MGNAFSAVADDFTGGYYNPGAVLSKKGLRFGFGYQYAKLEMEHNGNRLPYAHTHRDGLVLGYAFPLPFLDFLKDKVAFGFNLYQPPDYLLNLQVPMPSDPQFLLVESYSQSNFMNAAIAVRIMEGLTLGGGFTFTSDLGGALDLKPGIRSMGGGSVTMTTVDQDAQSMVAGAAGMLLNPGVFSPSLEKFTVALVWRGRFYMDLNIPITIMLGTIPLRLDFSSTLLYTPEMYTLGLAYRANEDLLFSADIVYSRWSDYLSPSLRIDTDIEIPILPVDLLPSVAEDPNFSDTITPRFGVEYRAVKTPMAHWVLRAGYAFEPSPIPEQTGWSNFLDGDKHVFSLGLGFEPKMFFGRDLSKSSPAIQAVVQYQMLTKTEHTKTWDIPRMNENPGYPSGEGEGHIYFFGLALTAEFGGSNETGVTEE